VIVIPQREAVHIPRFRQAVSPAEQRPEEDQLDADHPGLAEVILDEAGAQSAHDHGRDGADRDRAGDALVDGLDRAPARGLDEGAKVGDDLVTEVGDGGDQGPAVQGDIEGLVELLVVLQERVVLKPGNEDQVPGRRDRQELGEALDDPKEEGLEFGHRRGMLRGPLAVGRTPVWNQAKTKQPSPTIAAARPCLK
jgi:hypothetical protein